ncbi:MAG: hypothetical protein WBO95_10565 [Candidatus Dechloromonas phosphoritropha]
MSDNVRDTIDIYAGQPVEFTGLDLPERGIRVHHSGIVAQKIRDADDIEYVNSSIGYLNIVTDIDAGKAMGCRIFPAKGFDVPGIATASSYGMTGGHQFFEHGAPQPSGNTGQNHNAWCAHLANSSGVRVFSFNGRGN